MNRPIFHLAFPVSDLQEAKRFYVEALGCRIGRQRENWLDVYFFGHQITIHERPTQVLPAGRVGVRHFGVLLDWPEWEQFAARLLEAGITFESPPNVIAAGRAEEHGKFLVCDPSGNRIEVKSYKNPAIALELPPQ